MVHVNLVWGLALKNRGTQNTSAMSKLKIPSFLDSYRNFRNVQPSVEPQIPKK